MERTIIVEYRRQLPNMEIKQYEARGIINNPVEGIPTHAIRMFIDDYEKEMGYPRVERLTRYRIDKIEIINNNK